MGILSFISHQQDQDLAKAKFVEEKRKNDIAEQLRVLEVDRKSRGALDEIYSRFGGDPNDPTNKGNPKQLSAAMDDFAKAYSIETRQKFPDDLLKALKDPEFGKQVLQYSADKGMTMGEVFAAGATPMLRLQGRLAIAKHNDTNTSQAAAGAGTEPVAQPSVAQAAQANAAPAAAAPALGSGLTIPGQGGPGFAPPAQATPAPAAIAPAAPVAAPAPAGGVKALTPELQGAADTLQTQITNLTKNINIVATKTPDSKVLPILNDRLKTMQDHLFKLTGGSAQTQAEAEAQVGRTPVPMGELQRGQLPIGTRYRDVGAKGPVPQTPAQEAAAIGGVHSAQKEFDTTVEQGAHARRTYDLLDIASNAAKNAGVTGPWVTPVRENIYKLGNLFGVKTKDQTALQVMTALTPQFAIDLTAMMKGQQSDREFAAGVDSAVNKGQTQQAFAVLAYLKKEQAVLQMEQSLQARKWQGMHGSLAFKDENGRTFAEAWNKYREEDAARNGTFGERAARALNLDYKQVLKGNIVNAKRGG